MKKLTLNGIFPPLTTPFGNDKVSIKHFANNINKLNSTNLSGYVVLGSNGESCFLTREEKLLLINEAKKQAGKNKIIISGTGSDSILETISLTNDAANVGTDVALILTPSFFKGSMNHEALLEYFITVADKIKIPLLIYNVPKFTNVTIEPRTVEELSKHKNIIGIKSSSTDIAYLGEILNSVSSEFNVIAGTASILYAGLCLGASGGILACANILPNECVKVYDLYKADKFDESRLWQNKLLSVNKAVTATFGVAGLKKAMDLLGFYGGLPRSPLQELNANAEEKLKQILIQENFLKDKT
ncbi:MAG: dihydrodipicolinate synthase family protein [Ignavibacteriales bacterium CG_4_9_14_3_um_filter_30_11]|nr:MAG: dihydrodipicolinate synthase family protein [Ignavibacteriales bacterium CG_4_9_14_3_um_filter_30_11]